MATFYLINTITVGATKFLAGSLLSDAVHPVASVTAAGGLLWRSDDLVIQGAAARCAALRARGASESELDSVMSAAVNLVQMQQAPNSGAGLIAAWYVDAVNGSDTNSGQSASAAFKTLAKLNATLSNQTIYQDTAIYLLSDFPVSDPLDLNNVTLAAPTNDIFVIGTKTTVRTGTCTAFTDVSRSTNDETRLTDSGVTDWTPDLGVSTGRRVRNTTAGPNLNQIVWVAANVGAGVCSTSASYTVANFPNPGSTVVKGVFSPGDTYVVETLSKLAIRNMNVRADLYPSNSGNIHVQDCHLLTAAPSPYLFLSLGNNGNAYMHFNGCYFAGFAQGHPDAHQNYMAQCCAKNGAVNFGGIFDIWAGLYGPALTNGACISTVFGGLLRLDLDVTCWGGPIRQFEGSIICGQAGVFNSPTSGVMLGAGSPSVNQAGQRFTQRPVQVGTTAMYGKGNGGVGIEVGPGSSYYWRTTRPTITGTAGDFKLTSGGRERAFDEALGSYTAVIAATWANLDAATPGGFGGSAHDMTEDAHLVKLV